MVENIDSCELERGEMKVSCNKTQCKCVNEREEDGMVTRKQGELKKVQES